MFIPEATNVSVTLGTSKKPVGLERLQEAGLDCCERLDLIALGQDVSPGEEAYLGAMERLRQLEMRYFGRVDAGAVLRECSKLEELFIVLPRTLVLESAAEVLDHPCLTRLEIRGLNTVSEEVKTVLEEIEHARPHLCSVIDFSTIQGWFETSFGSRVST